jgi:hypothetical protein
MTKSAKKIAMVREAVGIFDNAENLMDAIDELQGSGFNRMDLSLLADAKTIEEKLGHIYEKVQQAEDDPQAPRTMFAPVDSMNETKSVLVGFPLYFVSTAAAAMVAVSGGTLLAAITAAMAGAGVGAMVGGILAGILGSKQSRYLQEQIEHGGILLWVNTHNIKSEKKAVEILEKYAAKDVHVHNITVGV